MTCSKPIRAQIALLEGGNLSLMQQWKLRLHCHTCAGCRAEQEGIRQMEAGLQSLASAPTPGSVYASLLTQLPELSTGQLPAAIHEDIVLDRNGSVRKRQQRRRWAIAATALLAIGAGGFAVAPNWRIVAANTLYNYWQGQRNLEAVQEFMNASVCDTEMLNAGYLARARELRELWKPWAMRHKQELKLMLDADTQNETVLRWVLCTLPITPSKKDEGISSEDLTAGSRYFWWSPEGRKNGGTPYHLREDFARYHDIVLARTSSLGNIYYNLWASGRTTAEMYISDSYMIASRTDPPPPATLYTREVLPPYEELTQKP